MATIYHDLSQVITQLDEKIKDLQRNMTLVETESSIWRDMNLKLAETQKARKILFDCCCGTQTCGWNPDATPAS